MTRLRRLLEEERRLRKEATRLWEKETRLLEEETRLWEEEARLREAAEQLARKQTFEEYLESCHSHQVSIRIINNKSSMTIKGEPTNPSNRLFPRRIIPWGNEFAMLQETTWALLDGTGFFSICAFPSRHYKNEAKSFLRPVISEYGLRAFEIDVMETPLKRLIDVAYEDRTV